MSTIKTATLREQERQALCLLIQGLWQVMWIRGLQVSAAEEETEMHATGEATIEAAHEHLVERIEDICKNTTLSAEGTTMEQLDRIATRLSKLEDLASPF